MNRMLRIAGVALVAGFLSVAPSIVCAQGNGSISGIVTDSVGLPILGVAISLVDAGGEVTTDDRGEFIISGAAQGTHELRARRLGFQPVTLSVPVKSGQTNRGVRIRMRALSTTLTPVLVHASRVEFTGRLAGYYERLQRKTTGYFIPRAELEKREYRRLSQVISSVPGVSSFQLHGGGSSPGAVRMRGRSCRPLVWLDGVPMPAGEVDLDNFPVNTLQGVELYLGSTNAPANYVALNGASSCGTILLWSRGHDTDPPIRKSRNPDLERLIVSLSVFTADQVDEGARLDPTKQPDPIYPAALFVSGTPGAVVAEFVVDTLGSIEPSSVSIVATSDPLFADAVVRALANARYIPAKKTGRHVRQFVQQPFHFVPGSSKAVRQ